MHKMTVAVSEKRVRSTWLTGAAGLLLLVTAIVMMVCAAPRPHAGHHGAEPSGELVSWVFLTRGSPVGAPVVPIPNGVRP